MDLNTYIQLVIVTRHFENLDGLEKNLVSCPLKRNVANFLNQLWWFNTKC